MLRLILCVIVSVLSTTTAIADPLFQTLPADGVGVKFHVNMTLNGREQARNWQVWSVGGRMVDGKPARWIELHGEAYDEGVLKFKLLIPESEFGRGKHPLDKAVEAWRKFNDGKPEKIDGLKEDLFMHTLLSGPGDVTKLDAKEPVAWQNGQFDCDVLAGSSQLKLGFLDVSIKHRTYYHSKAPFGFCGTRQEFTIDNNGQIQNAVIDARLTEIQTKQKTDFPDIE